MKKGLIPTVLVLFIISCANPWIGVRLDRKYLQRTSLEKETQHVFNHPHMIITCKCNFKPSKNTVTLDGHLNFNKENLSGGSYIFRIQLTALFSDRNQKVILAKSFYVDDADLYKEVSFQKELDMGNELHEIEYLTMSYKFYYD